ncbi:MAG: hypothetical protein ACJAVV_001186 [Alphaproteobacteria bacterium]|jgi:hypothetical protein
MNITERAFIIDKQLQGIVHGITHGDDNTSVQSTSISNTQTDKDKRALTTSMQAVVDAVLQPMANQSQQTRALVNTSLQYFIWYKQVVSCVTTMQSQSQAAASSASDLTMNNGEVDFTRQGKGFVVRLIQTTKQEGDAYVVLKLDDIGQQIEKKDLFLHCEYDQQIHVVQLGYVNKNKFQTLINVSNRRFKAIANEESHLYLT